jgi:uncharacterized protein (TIGR02145 family)
MDIPTNMMTDIKHISTLCLFCLGLLLLPSCSSDDDEPSKVPSTSQGTWTDSRDNTTYQWVRYDGQDWLAENLRYDINDAVNSSIYLDADEYETNPTSTRNLMRYGRLYTLAGAEKACPDGWRIPTDKDWQRLERAVGMSASDAEAEGWRGHIAKNLLSLYDKKSDMNLLLGGYYTSHTVGGSSGWYHMGAYAYFWTATADTLKEGTFQYVRKLNYTQDGVCRMSMEPTGYKLSLRLVRDAQ